MEKKNIFSLKMRQFLTVTVIMFGIVLMSLQVKSQVEGDDWNTALNSPSSRSFSKFGTISLVPIDIYVNDVNQATYDLKCMYLNSKYALGVGVQTPASTLHIHTDTLRAVGEASGGGGVPQFKSDVINPAITSFQITNAISGIGKTDGFKLSLFEEDAIFENLENGSFSFNTSERVLTILSEGEMTVFEDWNQIYFGKTDIATPDENGNLMYMRHYLGFGMWSDGNKWQFTSDDTFNGGSVLWSNNHGDLIVSSFAFAKLVGFQGYDNEAVTENRSLVIHSTGQVSIGSDIEYPGEFKLAVDGKIGAREIVITEIAFQDWPDYVFQDSYDLLSIEELDTYIQDNGHLPNIPTQEEVVEQGINLGEMNIKLLEKVEELSIYIIELNKDIEALKGEVDNLKNN